jgi:uncharacterized RDD family membrane protein YckC
MQDREARFTLRGKRFSFELQGWRARLLSSLLVWAFIALIALLPAACAFFAYAEGGTSLGAAIAYSVVLPVLFVLAAARSRPQNPGS